MALDLELPNWLDRIGVFDLETTGVDVETDRIVTAYVGVLDAQGNEVAAQSWIADPGIPIPDGAAAVHGITTERARREGRAARDVVFEVTNALASLFAQGLPVVAYNASYDFSLLAHECRRHGALPLDAPGPIVDPLVIDKAVDRYRKGKRTLEFVAQHYGVTLEGAHEASADAIAAGRVAQAIARAFPLATSAHELHAQQIGWARTQAESLTEYFIRIGRIEPEDALDGQWPVRETASSTR